MEYRQALDRHPVDGPPEELKECVFAALCEKAGPQTPRDLIHSFKYKHDWVLEVLSQLFFEGKVVAVGGKKLPFDLDTKLRVVR